MTSCSAGVSWRGDREDLRAHIVRVADQEVLGSCAPGRGGDPAKADPEQPAPATVADLHHRAHEACFIANSVRCPVGVEPL